MIDRVSGFESGSLQRKRLAHSVLRETIELGKKLVTEVGTINECMQSSQLVAAVQPALAERGERARGRNHGS